MNALEARYPDALIGFDHLAFRTFGVRPVLTWSCGPACLLSLHAACSAVAQAVPHVRTLQARAYEARRESSRRPAEEAHLRKARRRMRAPPRPPAHAPPPLHPAPRPHRTL